MPKIADWDAHIGGRVRLRDLHVLLTVVQCGSMAKAAANLGVSQPAVSETIASLERALDVRLLDRGRRGVEATVFGTVLLNSGKAAFSELRQGIKKIKFLSDPAAGELRIACPESISSGILAPIIKRISGLYPRVRLFVEQEVFGSKPAYPQLDNQEVDLVLTRLGPPLAEKASRAMNVEVLFNDRLRFAVGKHGRWGHRRKIDLVELVDEPWITVPPEEFGGAALAEAFRVRGLEPPRVTVITYSIHLRNSLPATAGFIAALPESVLRFNTEHLRELPIDLPTPSWPVVIITPRNRTLNPVVNRFIDCAREVAKSIEGKPRSREL